MTGLCSLRERTTFKTPLPGAYPEPVVNVPTTVNGRPKLSIGIIAWNEEKGIAAMLQSLLQQSLFAELSRRGQTCEIVCVANGCTDRTAEIAAELLVAEATAHPYAEAFTGRVMNLAERGKINAWNRFVHEFRGAGLWIMVTYHLGQAALVGSLLR